VNAWISTTSGNWSTATNWSKGTVPVATDTVWIKQSGTYTVTLTANGTSAQLDVGALLGTQTLALNGHALSVAGNFTTSSSGALQMTLSADSLDIGGTANFGGGTGTLSNGVIRVAGNFTQTGGASFAPGPNTSPQRVVLVGSTSQTISFASPTNSFFRRLWINKAAGGVVLGSNVRASFFRVVSGTAVTGPAVRLLTDTVYSSNMASSIKPLAVEITAVLGDSGGTGFSPDTTVFTGANQSISLNNTTFYPYAYKSIRVAQSAGTATFASNLSLPNDLVVSSGTLNLNAHTIGVTGNFRTEGSGVLRMASATDSLGVGTNATFGGGSTAGTLTAGIITINGNFVQSGVTTSFAPSGAHVVRFANTAGTTQTLSFLNPTTSFFDSLVVDRGVGTRGTVQLLTDVRVNGGMTIRNSTDVTGSASRVTITGGTLDAVLSTTSPTMTNLAIELSASPSIGASPVFVSPDTLVLNGTITNVPVSTGLVFKSVRANTSGTLNSQGLTYAKNLIVSAGTYNVASGLDSVGGYFGTQGSGLLALGEGCGECWRTLVVHDSAVFAGGTSYLNNDGYLRVRGNFVQRGGAMTFRADPASMTVFAGSTTQTFTFAYPGADSSYFGNLAIMRSSGGVSQSAGITLGSNVFVAGSLQDTTFNTGVTDSILGNGFTVTANGISTGTQFVMNNAPLVTNSTNLYPSGLTFRKMDPTITQWLMLIPSAQSVMFGGLRFETQPTTGLYFAALLTGSATSGMMLISAPVLPAYNVLNGSGYYQTVDSNGAVSVQWGGQTLTPW